MTSLQPRRSRKTLKETLLAIPRVGEDADFARLRDTGRAVRL
jgi:hypothetical protein